MLPGLNQIDPKPDWLSLSPYHHRLPIFLFISPTQFALTAKVISVHSSQFTAAKGTLIEEEANNELTGSE